MENGPADVASLKGDPRMAKVVARAVRTRQRALADDVAIPYGALLLRLTAEDSGRIVEPPAAAPAPTTPGGGWSSRRWPSCWPTGPARPSRPWASGSPASVTAFPGYEDPSDLADDEFDLEDFSRKVKRVPELAEALDRMWPRLSPHELLHDLFGAPPLIKAAVPGRTDPRGAAAPLPAALVVVRRGALDPGRCRPGRRGPVTCSARGAGSGDDGVRKYGHIVVDEVQDLSPMQLRMLTRRSLSGSMTVVGDIAQATAPWAPTSWADITDHLPRRRPAALGGADRQLPDAGRGPGRGQPGPGRGRPRAHAPHPGAANRGGAEDDRRHGRRGSRHGCDRRGPGPDGGRGGRARRWPAVTPGRVAILAPEPLMAVLADGPGRRRTARWSTPGTCARAACSSRWSSWPPTAPTGSSSTRWSWWSPGLIAGGTARGLRTLYVALTRPTQRLSVVHLAPTARRPGRGSPLSRSALGRCVLAPRGRGRVGAIVDQPAPGLVAFGARTAPGVSDPSWPTGRSSTKTTA